MRDVIFFKKRERFNFKIRSTSDETFERLPLQPISQVYFFFIPGKARFDL
jgi:hypothetical protein